MRKLSPIPDSVAVIAATAAIILQWISPETVELLRYPVLAIVVLFIGIPHGSLDHYVTARLYDLPFTIAGQLGFYLYYLVMVLLMSGIWLYNDLLGFLFFSVISMYHFGQADLRHLNIPRRFKAGLYLSRGTMILGLIVFSHIDYTAPVLAEITSRPILESPFVFANHKLLAFAAFIQYLLFQGILLLVYSRQISTPVYYTMGDALLVSSLFLLVDPILAFAVYFGAWHSLGHFREMHDFFRSTGPPMSMLELGVKATPFTLLTLIGLWIIYRSNEAFGLELEMVSLFFILISVLTLPHMLIVETMFSHQLEEDMQTRKPESFSY
ncbi:MAG: Brp/Blh family beta-carotene 15,15'-dioxygenase [Balneolaceae bacterium]|nr:Brp/Blh family beta-carotene 15,15'-dioxygenase [Balneolaceae bacterium]